MEKITVHDVCYMFQTLTKINNKSPRVRTYIETLELWLCQVVESSTQLDAERAKNLVNN